jgi:hypothetical protein
MTESIVAFPLLLTDAQIWLMSLGAIVVSAITAAIIAAMVAKKVVSSFWPIPWDFDDGTWYLDTALAAVKAFNGDVGADWSLWSDPPEATCTILSDCGGSEVEAAAAAAGGAVPHTKITRASRCSKKGMYKGKGQCIGVMTR